MINLKRLYLLSESEISDLYARPNFNQDERMLYFTMSQSEIKELNNYVTTRTRVYFMLQLGYFKAKNQFFKFDFEDVLDDVEYILSNFIKKSELTLSGSISRRYIGFQKQGILKLFDYQNWSIQQAVLSEAHLCELLRYYPKGHDALRQLLTYFENQKIVIPTYRSLQDMFTRAFSSEEKRLRQLLQSIPKNQKAKLSELINKDNGISKLNLIRADQKNFQYTAIKTEVDKALEITDLYAFAKKFIPTLKLSKNATRYYADLAEQYAASRLRRLTESQQWLQTICFAYHRYQQVMNNLITSFMYHTRGILDAGKVYSDMALMEHSSALVVDFPKLAKFLKWFPDRNQDLTHKELNKEAYNILPKKQFPALAKFLGENTFDKKAAKWQFYLKSSRMFSLYLRPILLTVPFIFYKKENELMELIDLIKTHYNCGKTPSSFKLSDDLGLTIPKKMTAYLKKNPSDEMINPHLFEFYVYQKMYRHLDKGTLCCNDSVSYCDIDHDLISDSLVDHVEKIAHEFGCPKIPIYCDEHLDEMLDSLDKAWDTTTTQIQMGENAGFKIKETKSGEKDWSLLYDRKNELDDAFFKTLPQVEIAEIVMFVGEMISVWDSFTHMKDRYNKKKKPAKLSVNACILSEAFGIGSRKMSEMSDLSYNLLLATQEDFIRMDTLCAANDKVGNFIHSLPIFKLWNLLDNKLLADADGQKLATSQSTIQSRYSTKYLGKSPGLSVYTLIANFIAVNAKNIGLNEYEGHSLYDMLYGNKTDINIDMITGDNHSLNQLNFVLLDSIAIDYVPSIKNVREAANDLYSVKPIESYKGILRPKSTINTGRIRSQKRGIQRILLSLLIQENTQTTIIKKLNSYSRYGGLKKALFEYNKLFKSKHILNLIDNMPLRKAIRTARNRTEAYHQLQGLIRKIYGGVFTGKKIRNNRVSAHATRLVANCIILYNSIILNTVYEKMLKDNVSQKIIDEFARISPIAWVHIAFTGRYSFKKSNGHIDVAAMAHELEKHLKQHFWKID